MHASRFDRLARACGQGTTRRRVLKALVAGTIGGALTWRQAPNAAAQCTWTGTFEAPFGGTITMTLNEIAGQVEGSYLFTDGTATSTGTISGIVRTDFPGYTVLDGYWNEPAESGRIWFSMPLDTCAAFAGSFTGTESSEQWTPGWDGARTNVIEGVGEADAITLFTNPDDSRVAAFTVDGQPTVVFGPKGADGIVEYIDHVQINAADGDPLKQVLFDFDSAGNLTRAALGSGDVMRFDMVDATRTIITYQSADGSQEVQFPLGAAPPAAALPDEHVAALVAAGSETVKAAFAGPLDFAEALATRQKSLHAAQESMSNRGLIEVRCASGQLMNAYVHGWYTGSNTPGQLIDLRFESVSTGVSAYVVPVKKAPPLDIQQQNEKIKTFLGRICYGSLAMTLTGTSAATACGLLVEAPPAAAACAALIISYRAFCGVNTAMTWVVGPTIDAFSDEVEVTAKADHPAFPQREVKVIAEAGEPIPTGVIQLAAGAAIAMITTTPIDPRPGEGYQIKVDTVCAPDGSQLTVSVAGTDSFATSTAATLSESVTSATLAVPGGALGIQDTITVQLTGSVSDTKTKAIIF